jgi:hypothetical protein
MRRAYTSTPIEYHSNGDCEFGSHFGQGYELVDDACLWYRFSAVWIHRSVHVTTMSASNSCRITTIRDETNESYIACQRIITIQFVSRWGVNCFVEFLKFQKRYRVLYTILLPFMIGILTQVLFLLCGPQHRFVSFTLPSCCWGIQSRTMTLGCLIKFVSIMSLVNFLAIYVHKECTMYINIFSPFCVSTLGNTFALTTPFLHYELCSASQQQTQSPNFKKHYTKYACKCYCLKM